MNDRERKIEAIVTAVVDHGIPSEIWHLSSLNGRDSAILETGLSRAVAVLLREESARCPSPSLHYSSSDDSLNTKLLTLADCGYCEGRVVVRL